MMPISFKENEKENIIALHLQTLSKKNRLLSPFVSKLRFLLNNPKYSEVIHWSPNGKAIIITDVSSFKENILQKEGEMFKTQNFSSFVRQLNLYGFRKIPGIGKCDTFKNMKFEHLYFRRERPDLMHLVQRTCLPSRHKKSRKCLANLDSNCGAIRSHTDQKVNLLSEKENDNSFRNVPSDRVLHAKKKRFVEDKVEIDDICEDSVIEDSIISLNETDFSTTSSLEHDYALPQIENVYKLMDEETVYEYLDQKFTDEKEVVQILLGLKDEISRDMTHPLSILAEVSSEVVDLTKIESSSSFRHYPSSTSMQTITTS